MRIVTTIGQLVGAVWERASNLMGLALTLEGKARTTLTTSLAVCATEDFNAIFGAAVAADAFDVFDSARLAVDSAADAANSTDC